MSILLDFSMYPLGEGESVSAQVARSLEIVDQSGLPYHLHSMGTTIEGEMEDVLKVVQECFAAMSADCSRISCSIKFDYREGATGRLAAKVDKVEQLVGRPLKSSRATT